MFSFQIRRPPPLDGSLLLPSLAPPARARLAPGPHIAHREGHHIANWFYPYIASRRAKTSQLSSDVVTHWPLPDYQPGVNKLLCCCLDCHSKNVGTFIDVCMGAPICVWWILVHWNKRSRKCVFCVYRWGGDVRFVPTTNLMTVDSVHRPSPIPCTYSSVWDKTAILV